MRRLFVLAAGAASLLALMPEAAKAQLNVQKAFAKLGDPAAFLSNNQQRFKFELDAIEHRFQSVFGGTCDGPPVDPDGDEKKPEPEPPEPPNPPPQPPPVPPIRPPGPEGQGVITETAPPPAPIEPEASGNVEIAETAPPPPVTDTKRRPNKGEIVGIDLLDANTERSISVNGFDPFNEQQLRQEFLETPLNLGNDDNNDDGGNDDNNNDNDDGGNDNNNDNDVGGFAPDTIVINAGPPPSQVEVYFNPETGDLSPIELDGTVPIDIGFDAPDLGFVFTQNGIVIVNPPVGNGSASLPVGRRVVVTINVPGFGRRRLAFTANANFTITVESLR